MEESTNMEFNINYMKKDTDQYIHFETKELCQVFCQKTRIRTGHRCCFGKGVLLYGVKNSIEAKMIKNDFMNTIKKD